MWYAVETAFIDGKHFASRPVFDLGATPGSWKGICMAGHDEEPMNTREAFMDGRIEIHTDWFQTKEQAMKFMDGSLTYIVHLKACYKKSINSTLTSFMKWEAVDVIDSRPPFRGIYERHTV